MPEVVASIPMTSVQIGDRGEIIINNAELANAFSEEFRDRTSIRCTMSAASDPGVSLPNEVGAASSALSPEEISADTKAGYVTIFDHDLNRFVYGMKSGGMVGETRFTISLVSQRG